MVAFLPIVKYAEMVMKRVLGNFKCGSGCTRDPFSILSSKVNHWSRNYRDTDANVLEHGRATSRPVISTVGLSVSSGFTAIAKGHGSLLEGPKNS